ncbi:heavy-metal-associated domain-containing protein [Propionicicella superfundia]|uniref:heavy-metal-associated domain-containing protein n=1 Tax=Propionicicella superfundia TaxID=348582 RepID=UPI0003F87FFE|nr:heavy-metal-associated domain-containing protein [Propionicicella superfundia]
MIATYKVDGMTCGHCAHAVTEEVSAVPGVSDVQVTLEGGTMVVTSEQPIALPSIVGAVAEAGDYTVVPA